LFNLKVIGGGDGKLIILIFITHPLEYLNLNFVTSYFLLLSFLFMAKFILNYILNNIHNVNSSFTTLFNLNLKYSIFERLYIKSFYRFLQFSKLSDYQEEKFRLKSLFLVFNNKKRSIEILVQIRSPFVIIIILTYLSVCLIKLTF